MKKLMIAALALSFMSGTVVFAQNTASSTDTMAKKKHKKSKKSSSTATDTTATK